jgi:uncharacterized protein
MLWSLSVVILDLTPYAGFKVQGGNKLIYRVASPIGGIMVDSSIFVPDFVVPNVIATPLDELRYAGIQGLLFDLDGTLLPYKAAAFEADVVLWLKSLSSMGFKVGVVTNGLPERSTNLCSPIDLMFTAYACKPLRRGMQRALKRLNLESYEVAMIGDQLFTDIWAAKRMGMRSVWVRSESRDGQPFVRRILENLMVRHIDALNALTQL